MKIIKICCALIIISGCTKTITQPTPIGIDLGIKATSTSIVSVIETNNIVTATFAVTPGSKYSVQIIPFNSSTPTIKEGFTASTALVTRVYDLSTVKKLNYDIHLLDIQGNESKTPITIK
jgi:hypothetical protein